MAIQKDVRIQFIEEKRGDAIQKIESELEQLNKSLTDIKQSNLQLKKDFGATSQEFVNGKKKELQAISDIKSKTGELKQINKQYSDEIKKVSNEIKEEKRKETEAKKKFEKDFSELVKQENNKEKTEAKKVSEEKKRLKKEETEAKKKFEKDFSELVKQENNKEKTEAKKVSEEKKRLKKEETEAKKKFEKDFSDFVSRHETIASASAKNKKNETAQVQDIRTNKIKDASYPEYLKRLRFELALLGTEQVKLALSGQREAAQYQNNKVKIQELKAEYKGLQREMQGLDAQSKKSTAQLLEMGENLTVIAFGIGSVLTGLFSLGKNAITEGAKLKVLRDNFKGTAEDLALLQKASAGTLSESELIPMYNKVTEQMKLTTEQTARLLAYSEDLADKGIGSLTENFNSLTTAILTGGRGLKSLGIDQKQFKEDLKNTATQLGINTGVIEDGNEEDEISIQKLDAKTQRVLILKTLFEGGYIPTLENVINKTQDEADKLEAFSVKMKEAESQAGVFIFKALEPMIDSLLRVDKSGTIAIGTIAKIGSTALMIIPFLAQLKIAFGGAALAATGLYGAAALAGAALGTLLANVEHQYDIIGRINRMFGLAPRKLNQNDYLQNFPKGNIQEQLPYGPELPPDFVKPVEIDLKKGIKTNKGSSESKEELLTLEKILTNLKKQIEANEELFKLGQITEKQKQIEYENILKTLQENKKLIEVTKGKLSEEEKSLTIKTNTVEYLKLESELRYKLGQLTEIERLELERKNKVLERSLEVLNNTKYKLNDLSTSNIPTHKLTSEQAEQESKRLQDIENLTRSQIDTEKNSLISSEKYKKAEFLLGSLSNFFERSMNAAWEGIFGNANNFATQFIEDFASQLLSMVANWGLRNLLNSIFPGAGIVTSFFGGGRAAGGDVNPGKFYVVGERGPEILAPQTAGRVIPNNAASDIVKSLGASNQSQKIVYVPVPVLSDISGNHIKLSYDRTNKFINNIKT